MTDPRKDVIRPFLAALLVANLTACGTLMHPERKGQTQGHIDVGIAALDAIGLLFAIIPGVIAYAVDFSNGTIYLPPDGGKRKHALLLQDLKRARFDPTRDPGPQIEVILSREIGREVRLKRDGAVPLGWVAEAELARLFAELTPSE